MSDTLTERQRQVAELCAQGYTYREIGRLLGISTSAANAHADVVRRKLGVDRKREIGRALREEA